MLNHPPLPASQVVSDLADNHKHLKKTGLTDLFNEDKNRHSTLCASAAGINLDYSHNLINDKTIAFFEQLFNQHQYAEQIDALFSGKTVNTTENRPALHTAIRSAISTNKGVKKDAILAAYEKAKALVSSIHNQQLLGFNETVITDIVNIGIGGSYLGPKLASEALHDFNLNKVKLHFIANIDPVEFSDCSSQLDPNSTLFIISSKSFGTEETISNAQLAKQWLGENRQHQLLAVTSNTKAAIAFGVKESHCLELWDWVGGRYSIWSNISLPIMLKIGCKQYEEMLAGGHEMDVHFQTTSELKNNIPMLLAMLEVWHNNFQQLTSLAILPYSSRLKSLPDYLQQLAMESNGKSVDKQGSTISYATNPVLWGSAGTQGQHSFHQLLHQGSSVIPCDFILPLNSNTKQNEQQLKLISNCLAQRRALLTGKSLAQVASDLLHSSTDSNTATQLANHKVFPGNRPSNLITFDKLTPKTFGALLAMYEHKTYACSILWNINAFDQWGVELGKTIGVQMHQDLNYLLDETDTNITAAVKKIDNPAQH